MSADLTHVLTGVYTQDMTNTKTCGHYEQAFTTSRGYYCETCGVTLDPTDTTRALEPITATYADGAITVTWADDAVTYRLKKAPAYVAASRQPEHVKPANGWVPAPIWVTFHSREDLAARESGKRCGMPTYVVRVEAA